MKNELKTHATDKPQSKRRRSAIVVFMVLSLFASLTMLTYSGAVDPVLRRQEGRTESVSIQTLNANSPSKEYVYAGARLVATEESQGCTPLLTATSPLSFPATPSPSTGTISVSIGAGCNWTATSSVFWITFPSRNSGTGTGSVSYSVAQNQSTSSIRNGTISINGQSLTVYQGFEFADVPANHPFYTFIGRLAARGVTLGCGVSPPNFCPDNPVAHQEMAAFIMRAKGEFSPPTPTFQRFADVPPSNLFYAFIDRMDALNIWNGCGPPFYCPTSPVKREQMAAMVLRGIGEFNPPTPTFQRFNDVLPSNPFYNFVDRLAASGITNGCSTSPPLFCPADSITRGQMAVFLVRAFNL